MSHQHYNHQLFAGLAAVILIVSGCAAKFQKPVRVCPDKKTAAELLSSLRLQLENAVPLKANGQCHLQYYTENNKLKKENFPVKLWMNPPIEIYMQGDVAFNPKGVVLGSNEEEFWLAVRLKEVSSYWWGRWSDKGRSEKLKISPGLVLEALGIAIIDNEGKWFLSNKGAFDVLTKQEGITETKKIHIDNCDYLVRKIEHFDNKGQAIIVTEVDKYKKISEDFFVPRVIKIISRTNDDREESIKITFSSVKPIIFTDKLRRHLFTRPEPKGFSHVYKILEENIIEQSCY